MMLLSPDTSNLKWFGFALSQFDIISYKHTPTMMLTVDPNRIVPRIFVNPDFVEELSDGQIATVLMHELWHYLNQTFSRQQLRDEEKWNFATDGVINWHIEHDIKDLRLKEDQFSLPGKCIRLPEEEFPTQDEIYSEGVYEKLNNQQGKDGDDNNSKLNKMFKQFQDGDLQLVDDHSGIKEFDKIPEELLKDSIGNLIKESTRMAGSEPGSMTRLLEKLFESIIPWTTLLRNFEGQYMKIGKRPSWKRPNRRFPGTQPGKTVKRGGKLVVLIDVSGSTYNDMPRFWGEAYELSKRHETWVVQCDMRVCGKPQRLMRGRMPEVKGGGGTDMNPGLELCAKMKPDMVIVFTDGELWDNNLVETGAPELWVICKEGSLVNGKRCIQIND
jgi:predicted metal-dependent peptidase